MKRPEIRHYTEEEILMHLFGEEAPGAGAATASHLLECSSCSAVWQELLVLRTRVCSWSVPEVPEEAWRVQKAGLLEQFRRDRRALPRRGLWTLLGSGVRGLWNYAVENPLPTIGYVAVGIAFASERTITMFHLDRILPATDQIFEILRSIF